MFSNILSTIKTTSDLDKLKDELDLLKDSVYQSGESSFQKVLKSQVRSKISTEISEEISKLEINISEYLESLDKKLDNFEAVKITLAIEPTELTVEKMHNFISSAINKDTALEITINPHLVGGVVISYKGEYRDFSLAKLIELEFEANREKLGKILQS